MEKGRLWRGGGIAHGSWYITVITTIVKILLFNNVIICYIFIIIVKIFRDDKDNRIVSIAIYIHCSNNNKSKP
jgi:hypothetical protein